MQPLNLGFHVNPSDETIGLGPLAVHFLITGENSNGSVATFEIGVPRGQRLVAPAHSHDRYEETIYGIDGVLTWTVNGKQIDVGPGQALCIPRGAVHRFDNHGSRDAKALRDHTCRDRSPVFPRVSRGNQRSGWWSTGSSKDGGNHASSRPHAGSASGVTLWRIRVRGSSSPRRAAQCLKSTRHSQRNRRVRFTPNSGPLQRNKPCPLL